MALSRSDVYIDEGSDTLTFIGVDLILDGSTSPSLTTGCPVQRR